LSDRAEEFYDLLLRLQEARYPQVQTGYLSFYYGVFMAESQSLQGRCRRRTSVLTDLRRDHDSLATEETNRKIVQLNEVVRRLTAITVILMVPTLIASHFGMNFVYMTELRVPWAYPAVILFQLLTIAVSFIIFRRIKWI
jgi:Mg2+ and Co2+ transporter CorA